MIPVKFVAFCQTKSDTAPRPGAAVTNVQLNAVLAAHLTDKDEMPPNADLFKDGNGGAYVQLSGVVDAIHAGFTGGKRYQVTIEEIA